MHLRSMWKLAQVVTLVGATGTALAEPETPITPGEQTAIDGF